MRISNVDCFISYRINEEEKYCKFKAHTKIRPGYVMLKVRFNDLDSFNLEENLQVMRLKIKSEWDGSMSAEPVRNSQRSPIKKIGADSVDLSEAESIQGENNTIKVDFDLYTLISEYEYFKGELVMT